MAGEPFYREGDPEILARLGDGRTVFRAVKSRPPHTRHFWSDYDAGKRPGEAAVLFYGISTFLELEVARERAATNPNLGRWIAEIDLRPERGLWFALTHNQFHATVWGLPDDLIAATVDVHPVHG